MTFDVGVSDLYQVAWWSVHVTSKPENIHKAVNASLEVLRNIATMRIMPYELERAKVTVLTKHDADTKVGRPLPRCLADPWVPLLSLLASLLRDADHPGNDLQSHRAALATAQLVQMYRGQPIWHSKLMYARMLLTGLQPTWPPGLCLCLHAIPLLTFLQTAAVLCRTTATSCSRCPTCSSRRSLAMCQNACAT